MKNNGLTTSENERLALLLEECGEVQQIIGKILRHGYESYNPFDKNKVTNRELLEKELGDLEFSVRLMAAHSDIRTTEINVHCHEKAQKINPYLHFNSSITLT